MSVTFQPMRRRWQVTSKRVAAESAFPRYPEYIQMIRNSDGEPCGWPSMVVCLFEAICLYE